MIAPEVLAFGIVGLGSSATLEVTLDNGTDAPVTLLSATLTEGNPDLFRIDRSAIDALAPGESGAIAVTYTPRAETPSTGLVQIRTDYVDTPFELELSGTGGPSVEDADEDGYSEAQGDCDDDDASQHPGADEVCDGQDTDCDGTTPADELDADADGVAVCEGDCDDANGARAPGKVEICDQIDNDCDQLVPDDLDQDGDGETLCEGDCDDEEPLTASSQLEVCDGLDNDCDAEVDNVDADHDGHSVCSLAGDCDDGDPDAYPVVVSLTGSAAGDGTDADPFDDLASALANLDAVCREVVFTAGTYSDVGADLNGADVTLRGETGDPADVVLEAPADARHFAITGGDVTIRGLTLTLGDSAEDGGSILALGASLTLSDVVFVDNKTATDGGALASVSSVVTADGCRFEGNLAADDGGAVLVDASTLSDVGSSYIDNFGVRGGALYVVGGSIALDSVLVRGNDAAEGGGVAVTGAGSYTIERSQFVLNTAVADGGGIALRDVTAALVRNNRFQDNDAMNGGGGGVAFLGANAGGALVNNTFHGNDAATDGAAILVDVAAASLAVRSNVMQSNDAPSALFAVAGVTVTHNTGWQTNTGVHFDVPTLDPTNVTRDPKLAATSDDGDPDNDDLTLGSGSPEIDSGVPSSEFDDADGSTNDRGYTGGPAAP